MEKEARAKVSRALQVVDRRFSQFATNGDLQIKTTWEEKQERRKKQQRTKELEKSLIEARIEQKRVGGVRNRVSSSKSGSRSRRDGLVASRTKSSR